MQSRTKSRRGQPEIDGRLALRLPDEILEGLAAWARAENRSTPAQAGHLLEQLVAARMDRLALTRR